MTTDHHRRVLCRLGPLLVLALAGVCASAGAVAGSARSTSAPGRIAFTRYRLQNAPLWSEIWVGGADGSSERKVSHSAKAVEDDGAQWSPRGDLIAFQRCPAGDKPCSVWVVRPDGSGQRPVAVCSGPGGCNYSSPSFAPDGKHVVYVHEWGHVKNGTISGNDQIDHSAIVESDLAGGHLRVLLRRDGYTGGFASPRISPGGQKLLFDRYGWNPARITPDVLYVADIAGGAAHRVLPATLQARSGSWSPDGRTILFVPSTPALNELTPGSNIYTVAVDGTHLRRITDVGPYHYVIAGSFSPEGRSIVFATDADATTNPRGGTFADVFTLRLGGGAAQPVTRTANLDGWPSWGRGG